MKKLVVVSAVVSLMVSPAAAMSQDHGAQIDSLTTTPAKNTSKISQSLQMLDNGIRRGPEPGPLKIKFRADMTSSEAEALVDALGGVLRMSAGSYHWVDLPGSMLEELSGAAGVEYIAPAERPYPLGDVSEGVDTMNTDVWRTGGLDGSGISVAVVDLGFADYSDAIASGDLPADIVVVDYCDTFEGTPHGTGVAEIVYDVAPESDIHLICVDEVSDLADAVSYAKANGIDVINHSVGWFNSSRGDGSGGPGTPEGIAEDAVDSGIVWVNASGNHAEKHWKGTFDDPSGDDFHEFVPGVDQTNALTLFPFETVDVFLKWDSWPTTSTDYDLYLWDHGTDDFVAFSTDTQSGSQPPVEQLSYTNLSGGVQVLGVAIAKFAGSGSPRMDVFITIDTLQYQESASSVVEPATHPDVVTVGATCWSDDKLASYSSRGPNIGGVKLPDVTAPTGVSTLAYGAGTSACTSGFTGTSSAAPHIAGMAALVLQGDPGLSPTKVADRLTANVIDLGGVGLDNKFGWGRMEAHGLCEGEVPSIVGTDSADTLNGTSSRDVIAGYAGGDTIKGKGGNDLICAGDGDDIVFGGNGNDEMRGQSGDDELTGGQGDDKFYGGTGENTASFANSSSGVTANLATESATGEGSDILKSILNLIGSSHADVLIGDDQDNRLEGRGDKDTLEGGLGRDTLIGGDKADDLLGGRGNDTLKGQKGSDDLRGGNGNDILDGGPGDDDIRGGNGEGDLVTFEDADGPVTADLREQNASGWGTDYLKALEEILGSGFSDFLFGDDGPNVIKGGAGDDDIRGRGGDDVLYGQSGTDTGHGGPGIDTCSKFESTTACE